MFVAIALPAFAISCARPVDHAEVAGPSTPLGTEGVAPGAPRVPWSGKTREQRMEFMGLSFHPRMKELFQKNDPAAYGKFRCQTCHGEDMEARAFAMPATLRKLSGPDPVGAGRSRDAKATDFMVAEVLPATKELIDRADCFSCHAAE